MIRKITYLFLLCIFSIMSQAQTVPHNSLYMFNDLVTNPAVCGTKAYDVVFLSHRNQWSGFEGAPETQFLSYTRNQGERIGLGASLFNDVTGPITTTGIQLSYGYNVYFSSDYRLSLGLSGSASQYVFDGNKAQLYDDIYDPAAPGTIEKTLVRDATFGTYLYNDRHYIGISIPQLIQSKIDISNNKHLARHYFIHSGYHFTLHNKFDVDPSVMLKATDASPLQYDMNIRITYDKKFWGGISYRDEDAMVVMFGLDYNNYIFGYSFDHTLSEINTYTNGSHSILIGYKFLRQVKLDDTSDW